jgi:hypothetical protein
MNQQFRVRSVVSRLAIAAVFAGAAWASWSESRLSARVADTREAVTTLDYAGADTAPAGRTLSDVLPGTRRKLSDEIRVSKASVAYWLGRYGDIAADTKGGAVDADILLAAANAAYRDSQRDPGAGLAAVQKLDGVLQAYASALKATADVPGSAALAKDAAYNYEYVSRIRDIVARTQGKGIKALVPPPFVAGDLPVGATIHGAPGGPPPDAKMEDLQMIAPMEYGDREAQPEATPGAKRGRKG